MKVIFLDIYKKQPPQVMEIDGELDTMKTLIGCAHIDSTLYKVGDTPFRVIVDDDGYFKKNYIVSAHSPRYIYPLVGNLIICGQENRQGDLRSLSEGLAKRILRRFELGDDGYYRLYAD